MATTVIKLNSLADPIRPTPQYDDLLLLSRLSFVFFLVGRVEVRRIAFKLGGASVYALIDRRNSAFFAQMTNFFLCFFPILIGYYPLFLLSLDLAKGGQYPTCSVWLGNVMCIVVGIWLMNKVLKN